MHKPLNIANDLAILKEQAKQYFDKLLDTLIEIVKYGSEQEK